MFEFSKRRSILSAPKDQGQEIQMVLDCFVYAPFRNMSVGFVFKFISKSRLSARSFLFKSKTHLAACMLIHFGLQIFSQLNIANRQLEKII